MVKKFYQTKTNKIQEFNLNLETINKYKINLIYSMENDKLYLNGNYQFKTFLINSIFLVNIYPKC
jgi:hypothetical protein